MQIKLIEQNPYFLIAEKPSGLSVHNASEHGNDLITLLHNQIGQLVYPVHRLDLETSGLIILALNGNTAKDLCEIFSNNKIEKKYQCIVKRPLPINSDWSLWTYPLTDKSEGRKNPQGKSSDRKPCTTKYKVLQANSYFSLLDCRILTGRQHQIRKHAALFKSPIVGDNRYGDPKYNQKISSLYKEDRMFLHSYYLKFEWKNQSLEFISEIPAEFHKLLVLPSVNKST
jgi:tRNA pseudouridine65 synthase